MNNAYVNQQRAAFQLDFMTTAQLVGFLRRRLAVKPADASLAVNARDSRALADALCDVINNRMQGVLTAPTHDCRSRSR
jgi:hypothetical protein